MANEREKRKDEHIQAFEKTYDVKGHSDFDQFQLIRPTLPESAIRDVNLSTVLFHKKLEAPLYINAMTGGTERSKVINDALSRIASHLGIGFALGSEAIIKDKEADISSFTIARKNMPNGLLFSNCNPNVSIEDLKKILQLTSSDALQIHLNAIQEITMAEGDREFKWLEKIKNIVKEIEVPVIIKETGFGFDRPSILNLKEVGVRYLDVAGKGGTDFNKIEAYRKKDFSESYLSDLGFSTIQSLFNAQGTGMTLFASGGIRTPLDAFKCLVLNSKAVGLSGIVLKTYLTSGEKETETFLKKFIFGLKNLFALFGIQKVEDCSKIDYYLTGDLFKYVFQEKLKNGTRK